MMCMYCVYSVGNIGFLIYCFYLSCETLCEKQRRYNGIEICRDHKIDRDRDAVESAKSAININYVSVCERAIRVAIIDLIGLL